VLTCGLLAASSAGQPREQDGMEWADAGGGKGRLIVLYSDLPICQGKRGPALPLRQLPIRFLLTFQSLLRISVVNIASGLITVGNCARR
jgi:hypothetical protein